MTSWVSGPLDYGRSGTPTASVAEDDAGTASTGDDERDDQAVLLLQAV